MRNPIRFCVLPLLLAASAFGQTYPQGPNFYPDELVGSEICIYIQVFENGRIVSTTPVPGVTVTFNNPIVTPTSGWHTHEGTIGNPARPTGYYTTATAVATDSSGCAVAVYQMANWAGTYTFTSQHISPLDEQIHVNGVVNNFEYASPIWGPLVPYLDNPAINAPQNIHQDPGHSIQTRYLILPVQQALSAASSDYLINSTQQAGIVDRLDIVRGSIPWGGISDNEVYGADLWFVSAFEEHQWGSEVDISNPNGAMNGLYAFALQSLQRQGCTVGSFQKGTGGKLSDPISYWQNQNLVHIVCSTAAWELPGSGKSPSPIGGGRQGYGK
jgi:hypothetical protein